MVESYLKINKKKENVFIKKYHLLFFSYVFLLFEISKIGI